MARMEDDTELDQNISEHTIELQKKQVWLDSLRLPVEYRIRNCGMLAQIWLDDSAEDQAAPNAENMAVQAVYEETHEKEKKGLKPKKKMKLRPLYIVGAVGVAAGCYFGWVEYHYQKAVEYAEAQYFDQAVEETTYLPVFYRDSTELNLFTYAGQEMEQGKFDFAKSIFTDLGDYRDSSEMVKEVDYEEAFDMLENGKYDGAKYIFKKLGNYKDAEVMITEADYRKAIDLLNEEDYLTAYPILIDIQGYSDVNDILYTLEDVIYWEGVDLYETGAPVWKDKSKKYFELVEGYLDADYYIQLIEAQHHYGEKGYQELLELAGFEDAVDIIMSDKYLEYYLKGYWSDGYGDYFEMREDEHTYYNIPWYDGEYYRLTDSKYQVGKKGNWRDCFKFTFVSPNEIIVYCYKNNRMYEMYRQ